MAFAAFDEAEAWSGGQGGQLEDGEFVWLGKRS